MHIVYALARTYAYWALPVAFVVAEIGLFFRRRKSPIQYYCWTAVGFIGFTWILWIALRGDLNSDTWLRSLIG